MLELICHHSYDTWEGLAADRSPRHSSHGTTVNTPYSADGFAAGSGSLRFGANSSVVRVAPDGPWQALGRALKVEVVVFLDPPKLWSRTIVDGNRSFRLFLRQDQLLGALTAGRDAPPPGSWVVNSGSQNSPDGQDHSVPHGKWVLIGMSYDGFSSLELTIDGLPVGRQPVPGVDVAPVGPAGIAIGNNVGTTSPLIGEIDDVKVWRYDPDAVKRNFLGRPYSQGSADCWTALFRKISDAFEETPEALQALARSIAGQLNDWKRTAANASEPAREELFTIIQRYLVLWRRGSLDTDEMEAVFRDLFRWWRVETGRDLASEAQRHAFPNRLPGSLRLPRFDCDPDFAALSARIAAAAFPGGMTDAPDV